MGVDLIVSGASLGKVAEARCRPFRPGAAHPVLFTERKQSNEEILIRRVFPLETLPLPVITPDGSPASEHPVSDERFAVDVTLKYWRNLEEERTFNAWLSRQEYEALKTQHYHKDPNSEKADEYIPSINLSPKEWQFICESCPLHFPIAIDCAPRLFSYGALPLLRRAVAELGSGPYRTEFSQLSDALGLIFAAKLKETGSQAARQDQSFQAFFSSLTKSGPDLGITPKYLPESPPDSRTDKLLDMLFFWDNKQQGWVSGKRLTALAAWLDQFMGLLERLLAVMPPSEEMKVFLEVMNNYYMALKQAHHYNLKVKISW